MPRRSRSIFKQRLPIVKTRSKSRRTRSRLSITKKNKLHHSRSHLPFWAPARYTWPWAFGGYNYFGERPTVGANPWINKNAPIGYRVNPSSAQMKKAKLQEELKKKLKRKGITNFGTKHGSSYFDAIRSNDLGEIFPELGDKHIQKKQKKKAKKDIINILKESGFM